jgi:hypothetical protein
MIKNPAEKFFFSEIDARPAAITRIATGSVLLITIVIKGFLWQFLYEKTGWISLETTVNTQINKPFGLLYWSEGIIPTWTYLVVWLASTITYTIGYKTKTSALISLILLQSLAMRNAYSIDSCDMVLKCILFFSCFGSFAATWSIDSFLRSKKLNHLALAWPIRMVQISICMIYFWSLFGKLFESDEWVSGSALYLFVANPVNGVSFLSHIPLLISPQGTLIMSWVIILIQLQFILLIWLPKTQTLSFCLTFSFQLLLMSSSPPIRLFSLAMMVGLLTFLPSNIMEWLIGRKTFINVKRVQSLSSHSK